MRYTADMMDDSLSEDTMMDCGDDVSGLADLVNLASDIADSSPTIRDAAERLLTLLGVDDDDEYLSSSEDEGVELDIDDSEDEEEDPRNTRLLHQLAASLAQELKYAQQKQSSTNRQSFEHKDLVLQSMETSHDTMFLEQSDYQNEILASANDISYKHDIIQKQNSFERERYIYDYHDQVGEKNEECRANYDLKTSDTVWLDERLRMDDEDNVAGSKISNDQQQDYWSLGWDACATEALRYLVEDEGLPLHHPTVVAMKNHLDLQRQRAFARFMS